MKRAVCLIKDMPHYRRSVFESGLLANNFVLCNEIQQPTPDDILVIWNRSNSVARIADSFEKSGATVLVAENGYLGNEFAGKRWYALSRSQHNGAGWYPAGSENRWDSLEIELQQWREDGKECVMLPQRGFGAHGVAMPRDWVKMTQIALQNARLKYRVRPHPGKEVGPSLEKDLTNASSVITWGSGAALKALVMGIPCFHGLTKWIGAPASRSIDLIDQGPLRDDAARLSMFRGLAWAMWTTKEISDGDAFEKLLPAR